MVSFIVSSPFGVGRACRPPLVVLGLLQPFEVVVTVDRVPVVLDGPAIQPEPEFLAGGLDAVAVEVDLAGLLVLPLDGLHRVELKELVSEDPAGDDHGGHAAPAVVRPAVADVHGVDDIAAFHDFGLAVFGFRGLDAAQVRLALAGHGDDGAGLGAVQDAAVDAASVGDGHFLAAARGAQHFGAAAHNAVALVVLLVHGPRLFQPFGVQLAGRLEFEVARQLFLGVEIRFHCSSSFHNQIVSSVAFSSVAFPYLRYTAPPAFGTVLATS